MLRARSELALRYSGRADTGAAVEHAEHGGGRGGSQRGDAGAVPGVARGQPAAAGAGAAGRGGAAGARAGEACLGLA